MGAPLRPRGDDRPVGKGRPADHDACPPAVTGGVDRVSGRGYRYARGHPRDFATLRRRQRGLGARDRVAGRAGSARRDRHAHPHPPDGRGAQRPPRVTPHPAPPRRQRSHGRPLGVARAHAVGRLGHIRAARRNRRRCHGRASHRRRGHRDSRRTHRGRRTTHFRHHSASSTRPARRSSRACGRCTPTPARSNGLPRISPPG
jgi:hypothetical protein